MKNLLALLAVYFGHVSTYHLVDGQFSTIGLNYSVSTGLTTTTGGGQPGSGTGFTINVTAITVGDGSFDISLVYYLQ